MKKTVLLVFLLLLIPISAITASIADISMGFAYYKYEGTLRTPSTSESWFETRYSLTVGADIMLFGKSNHGIDLGFTFLYPVSSVVNDEDVKKTIADSDWGFRLGAAQKFEMSDNMALITSFGYQLLMNNRKLKDEATYDHREQLLHGLFFQGKFIVKLEETLSISVGGLFIVPVFGSVKKTAEDTAPKKYRYTFKGIILSPSLGIKLSM